MECFFVLELRQYPHRPPYELPIGNGGKAERPQCGEKRGESPVRKGAEGTRSRGECRDYFELWEGRQFESVHQLQTKQHLIWVLFLFGAIGRNLCYLPHKLSIGNGVEAGAEGSKRSGGPFAGRNGHTLADAPGRRQSRAPAVRGEAMRKPSEKRSGRNPLPR